MRLGLGSDPALAGGRQCQLSTYDLFGPRPDPRNAQLWMKILLALDMPHAAARPATGAIKNPATGSR